MRSWPCRGGYWSAAGATARLPTSRWSSCRRDGQLPPKDEALAGEGRLRLQELRDVQGTHVVAEGGDAVPRARKAGVDDDHAVHGQDVGRRRLLGRQLPALAARQ